MGGIQRGREGGRREGDRLKEEEEWGHFLPEEVLSSETTFLKNRGPCNVFIIVVFPRAWLRQREKSVVKIHYNSIFYDSPNAFLV